MSNKAPISVQGSILATNSSGSKVLTISSRVGEFEFAFAPDEWNKLSDSAGWHRKDSGYTNGVHKTKET